MGNQDVFDESLALDARGQAIHASREGHATG